MKKQYSDYEKTTKDLTSDFNEAKLQVFRISNHLQNCAKYASEGKLDKWNWELDAIWRELSRDAEMKDENKDNGTYTQKISELNSLVAKYKYIPSKLYKILEKKEIILRRLQDDAGKGSKRSSEEEEDDIDS